MVVCGDEEADGVSQCLRAIYPLLPDVCSMDFGRLPYRWDFIPEFALARYSVMVECGWRGLAMKQLTSSWLPSWEMYTIQYVCVQRVAVI